MERKEIEKAINRARVIHRGAGRRKIAWEATRILQKEHGGFTFWILLKLVLPIVIELWWKRIK